MGGIIHHQALNILSETLKLIHRRIQAEKLASASISKTRSLSSRKRIIAMRTEAQANDGWVMRER